MKNRENKKEKKNPVKSFFADFKEFMSKGNVLNLAIAFVMGAAFNAIVTSLVNDLLMPLIGLMMGKSDISEWIWVVNENLQFNYGKFIYAIVNFIIIAFTLFIIIKIASSAGNSLKKMQKKLNEEPQTDAAKTQENVQAQPAAESASETTEDILKSIRSLLEANKAVKTDDKTPQAETDA